jgi:translocation and assembly module TamA
MSRRIFIVFALLLCRVAAADVRLEINGVESLIADNIRNHIGTLAESDLQRSRQLKQKLNSAITGATQALGYYETKFRSAVQQNTLTIDIDLGPPIVWQPSDIVVTGDAAELRAVKNVLAESPIAVGAIVNHQAYETLKRRLLEACQENGFLGARFKENQLLIDIEQHRGTAILHVDSGARYRFKQVQFSGSTLDAELLEHLSPIAADSYYSKEALAKLQRNLQDSRYFQEMDVRTERQPNNYLAVNVKLADAPRHQFSVGAGFGTDTGPRAKFRWERPLITTKGHKLTTELSIAKPEQDLSFEYHIPLDSPLDKSLNFTTSWKRKLIEDTDSSIGSIGFFLSDRYAETWQANYGATFNDESYRQGSEPRKRTQYIVPGINVTQLVLPTGIDPLRGRKVWAGVNASAPPLGADTAFVRTDIGYKQIFNPIGKQLLIARAEIGTINTDNINEIPATQRFFTGGDQTVRGYDFESLAPRDEKNELIGGKYLNVASVEYSVKVAEQWRGALFMDGGRAFNSSDEPWHKSIGFGARWLSPVGQIRVDLAFPFRDEEQGWRLHIFMGPPL